MPYQHLQQLLDDANAVVAPCFNRGTIVGFTAVFTGEKHEK